MIKTVILTDYNMDQSSSILPVKVTTTVTPVHAKLSEAAIRAIVVNAIALNSVTQAYKTVEGKIVSVPTAAPDDVAKAVLTALRAAGVLS